MVFGVTRQSGGSIAVFSELDGGTTFKIYLPRAEADRTADATVVETSSSSISLTGCETILLVEDEPAVRNLAARILSRNGYTVVPAADGGEALELCLDETQHFDLLVSDVVLPGIHGRVLVERLRATRPHLKVLYMSGYPRDVIAHAGRLDEGIDFLEKPFTADALAHKVREVLDSG